MELPVLCVCERERVCESVSGRDTRERGGGVERKREREERETERESADARAGGKRDSTRYTSRDVSHSTTRGRIGELSCRHICTTRYYLGSDHAIRREVGI